jgi:hypothetical protein
MAKQTFTTGQVLLASQLTSLQQTALGGGAANAKTASYTLVAADAGTAISMTSTSATTITVNTGLFAAGDTVLIQNLGSGTLTITAGSATVNTSGNLALGQYDNGILYFVSASSAIFNNFAGSSTGDITGVTAGTGLTGGGSSGAVSLALSTPVAATNGGTAQSTYTTGDMIYASASNTLAKLGIGSSGQVLSVSGGIPAWATASGGSGALVKITSAPFTTQSSVAVDDVFTATYKTYYVFWSCSASVDGADLQMQFRYAGPNTQATDYYGSGFGYDRSNTLSTWGFSNTNQATIYNALQDAGNLSYGYITFDDVGNASAQAKYFGNGFGRTTQTVINYAGFQNTSRTYTGFLLKPDSGTITGRYQVYGLEN